MNAEGWKELLTGCAVILIICTAFAVIGAVGP